LRARVRLFALFAFYATFRPATPTGSKVTVVLPQLLMMRSSRNAFLDAKNAFTPDCTIGPPNWTTYAEFHILRLKWPFCDLDTENSIADLHALSEEDLKKGVEPLSLRAIQFCLFVNTLIGEDATVRIMQHAVRCAKESPAPASGE